MTGVHTAVPPTYTHIQCSCPFLTHSLCRSAWFGKRQRVQACLAG